jgi:RNA polymerase sigma-70 factor, ECF subfamily
MDESRRELILKARQGDPRAFEQLVRQCDRRLLALALDLAGNAADAQDIFQEALIAAHRALPRFRLESDFFTWLYRIAVNQALRFRRRREFLPGGIETERRAAGPDPEQAVLEAELQSQFELALDRLSGQERIAFVLCHRQGLRIAQAAAVMVCSEGSVKSYLFRAREKMKAVLQPYLES